MMLFLVAGNDVIGGLDFRCRISAKTIISRYSGRIGKNSGKTGSIFLGSLAYERTLFRLLRTSFRLFWGWKNLSGATTLRLQ